jgi:EAL domain-containing protein (putative c-di-GMP-specific phosphodiesterase class I)
VLLDDIKDSSDTTRVAERIKTALDSPIEFDGREVFTTASIGIAVSEQTLDGPEQLLRHADTAMYRAKARGRGRYELFDQDMHRRAIALRQLEAEMREAVAQQQFRLVYLPIVNIATKRISGFEALVRWQHPDRGTVPPESFIKLAEETGVIVPLGSWILREACVQMAQWTTQYPDIPDLFVSVNLTAKQLHHHDLIHTVRESIESSGVVPERLKLEISETVLMDDPETNIEVIHKLRELGVRIHIDDFGTGTSSLSYLSQFRVDTLKIDRSLIGGVGLPGEKTAVVEAMIALARNLGIHVIAEGVETHQQSQALMTFQCEQAQGHLFSQPVDAAEAAALMDQESQA